jgi:CBS domain-containing membrane protein
MPYRLLAKAAARATGRLGWARAATGALLGIAFAAVAGVLAATFSGSAWGGAPLPWLVAPVGASAVLVFALPASPLAQPWPVIGGNMLSGAIGLAMAHFVAPPSLACALAVGTAIAAMSLARCLHPPGGACALLGALSGPPIAGHGWVALLLPLAMNIGALLAAGWLYNNLTGHSWPHHIPRVPPMPPEGWIGSYDAADLDSVLEDWDEVLDVSREDLDALFRAVERRVQRRWMQNNPK